MEGAVRGVQSATRSRDDEAMAMSLHRASYQTAGAPKNPAFSPQPPGQALLSEN